MKRFFVLLLIVVVTGISWGKVDLVTLPARDTVQLTIYNSADLTLARESRALTVKKGVNKLQFSWANTLIDPTSLEMLPLGNAHTLEIADLTFPPRVKNLGLWNVTSEVEGEAPVQISYLTSGISWRAFYMGTLTADEKTMRLQGYVRVTNNSGEDYEDAQVRLIVGKVHMLDRIADLAKRQYPYDRPGAVAKDASGAGIRLGMLAKRELKVADGRSSRARGSVVKEVVKEGLSEYFLYTIDGTETIPTGWSKRLQSFEAEEVGVVNLYKYEEERYGGNVMRFLSFKNDEEHELGETPLPGGMLKVYRNVDEAGHLSYEGQSAFKYIPVDEDVELNLGAVSDVVVEPKLMEFATERYEFNKDGNVTGWDEIRTFDVEVRKTRDVAVKIEIKRNFRTQYWTIKNTGDTGKFEKEDLRTVKYTLQLDAGTKKQFKYAVRTYHGSREEDWRK